VGGQAERPGAHLREPVYHRPHPAGLAYFFKISKNRPTTISTTQVFSIFTVIISFNCRQTGGRIIYPHCGPVDGAGVKLTLIFSTPYLCADIQHGDNRCRRDESYAFRTRFETERLC